MSFFSFFPSLLLFWRVFVLASRIFVFYIILKKRVVDRGCAVPLPGNALWQVLFSRYPCLVEHFVFVSVVFVSPQHLSKSLWLVGKPCDIQTFIGLSAIACFLPLSVWVVLIFFLFS